MPAENKTITQNNLQLSYTIEGKGIPLVLIHGFGEDKSIWDQQALFLKDHCKLIIPDLPGTGNSLCTSQPELLTVELMAESIRYLLDQEKINSCFVLGHSMGGYVTLAFAELYPGYLKGFGLVHSTGYADSAEKKKNRLKSIEVIGEYGGYAFFKNTIGNLFGERFKEEQPEAVGRLIEKSKTFSNKSLQYYCSAMMQRTDRSTVLKDTTVPVLYIAGTEDIAAPIEDVLAQAKLSSHIELHVLEGVGHMGMLEATDQVNGYILNFIEKNN